MYHLGTSMHCSGAIEVQKCSFRKSTARLTAFGLFFSECVTQALICLVLMGHSAGWLRWPGGRWCWFWLTWTFCQVDVHGKGCGQGERFDELWLKRGIWWRWSGAGHQRRAGGSRWLCLCSCSRQMKPVCKWWAVNGFSDATVKLDQYWWKKVWLTQLPQEEHLQQELFDFKNEFKNVRYPLWITQIMLPSKYLRRSLKNESLYLGTHWYLNSDR